MSTPTAAERFFISSRDFEPAYLTLYRNGELQRRVQQATAELTRCEVCPRNCRINRLDDHQGVCRTGRYAVVSSAFAHRGEENCLRGWNGSGTIFFSWCNLKCQFCQNEDISQSGLGITTQPELLAQMMLQLQTAGCHNINLVTPEHVVPQVLEALVIAVKGGLRLPIVYNTSAYDAIASLRLLDGIVDIYLPDFKIWDAQSALRYLKAKNYPEVARAALTEMQRQVGELKLDENGLAKRGVLVRHLVMPRGIVGTAEIMRFLSEELSPDTYVNLMSQYHPAGRVSDEQYPELNRLITPSEYKDAVKAARAAKLWRFDQR